MGDLRKMNNKINTMEKKLRGRPLKREEDKLIGRRISMVQNNWDLIDEFCELNNVTVGEFLTDLFGALLLDAKIQN